MKNLIKGCLILIVGLLGSFITNQIYNSITDLKFTVAFLGGAITLAGVLGILNYKTQR